MRHYRRQAGTATAEPISAIVHTDRGRFLFFKWPEGAWLAHVDMDVRGIEGVSAFEPPEARR